MRWEDERWVKVYTRDTVDWCALSFEAQGLFMLLLRKVDRAGLMPLGKHGKRGVAVAVGHPQAWPRLEPALEELLADGCVSITPEGALLVPNFIAAQEAKTSSTQRVRALRERDRDKAIAHDGIRQHAVADIMATHTRSVGRSETHAETPRNAVERGGTNRVDKTRVEKSREDLFPEAAVASPAPAKKAKEAKKEPTEDPRHAPLSLALTALGWPHHGGRTAKALKDLLALADQVPGQGGASAQGEIMRRAARARASTGFPQVRELHELATHWGHFAGSAATQTSSLPKANDPDWVTV